MILDLAQLHPGQEMVVNQARRYNVARCGRRYGKTTLAVNRMLLHRGRGVLNGYPVGFFAPSSKYFSEIWLEVNEIVRPVVTRSNITERQIRLYGGGLSTFGRSTNRVQAKAENTPSSCSMSASSRPGSASSGSSQCSRLFRTMWRRLVLLQAEGSLGYANELYARGQGQDKDWISWSLKTEGNPYILKSEIEAAKNQLPASIFAQEYEAVPAADGGNPFGLDEIASCVAPISGNEPAVWAWDLAKSVDFTTGGARRIRIRMPSRATLPGAVGRDRRDHPSRDECASTRRLDWCRRSDPRATSTEVVTVFWVQVQFTVEAEPHGRV